MTKSNKLVIKRHKNINLSDKKPYTSVKKTQDFTKQMFLETLIMIKIILNCV